MKNAQLREYVSISRHLQSWKNVLQKDISYKIREIKCCTQKYSWLKIISSNQFRVNFYGKKLLSRIFCEQMVAYGNRIP